MKSNLIDISVQFLHQTDAAVCVREVEGGPDNVPVAFSDFSGYCDDYEQKGDKEIREIADKLEARFKETMKILKDID